MSKLVLSLLVVAAGCVGCGYVHMTVTYAVDGIGNTTITYTQPTGEFQTVENAPLPWSITISAYWGYTLFRLAAPDGDLSITVDGVLRSTGNGECVW